MKGLISFKVERPYLWDAVARHLISTRQVAAFDGIVTSPRVHADLSKGPYAELVLLSDLFRPGTASSRDELERLESEYGDPTLWSTVVPDRRLYSPHPAGFVHNALFRDFDHRTIQQLLVRTYLGMEQLLDRCQPDFIVLESAACLDEAALLRVARKRGVEVVFLSPSRVADRYFFTSRNDYISDEIVGTAHQLQSGAGVATSEEAAFSERIVSDVSAGGRPAYVASVMDFLADRGGLDVARIAKLPGWLRALGASRQAADSEDPNHYRPSSAALGVGLARLRAFRDRRPERWDEVPDGEPFMYFPLHFQPEATTSVCAPTYLDQAALIEICARSIPVSWSLCVKEHPASIGSRSSSFYARIRRAPNVRLIPPEVDSHALIRNARLTLAINGTAAWEAAVLGKTSIVLAPTLFDVVSSVSRFDGPLSQLPQFIAEVSDGQSNQRGASVENYLAAVYRHTFAASGITMVRTARELTETSAPLAEELMKFLGSA